MLDRPKAREWMQRMSTARVDGDVDSLVRLFHEDGTLRIVGAGDPVAGGDLRATIQGLVDQFEFIEWSLIKIFVDGDDIVSRHRLKVRHHPTGKIAETETCEFLTLRDGRCKAFTQFTDTALIAAMSQPAT